MNESPSTDTGILMVSIVAGPSASALMQQIAPLRGQRRRIVPAGGIAPEGRKAFEQISEIAQQGDIDHLVIACDSDTPVMAYASLFFSPPLSEMARLTKTVLAIHSSELIDSLIRGTGNSEHGSSCVLAEQLEFAGDIVLDGGNEDPDFKLARDVALTLNPQARVSTLSQETAARLLDEAETTSFDFGAALDGAGWRQLIESDKLSPTAGNQIATLAYRARRPFHPEKFSELLQGGLSGVFRAKGFFWLATRMDLVGGLNLAGPELHCAGAGQWWAARDEQTRQQEMPERTRKEWKEPFGDRRQAIALMGLYFQPDVLKAQLDACLLADSEMSAGPESWATMPDPFPSWTVHAHTHECDHDHEPGDHECCHH